MFQALTLITSITLASRQVLPDWRTHYEKSNYLETGRYQEAVDYCRRLSRASPYARVITYGRSPEGREMVVLVLSKEKAFTPGQAARSKKPLVIINNGIHSGEIEGKDADLILAREILITKKEEKLIDGANIVIIPVFSVDAHERFDAYNRINQNGPREMGWRSTAQNLNLNRDFIKADGGEMKAMIRLLHTWKPDFFFDNHTTDGGDWQYVAGLDVPVGPTQSADIVAWNRRMLAWVWPRIEGDGFLLGPYFSLEDTKDPTKGLSSGDYGPRYSTGYHTAINRPSMLVETHMLKPYKQRVEATYSINKRVIEYCGATAPELKAANGRADMGEERIKEGDPFILSSILTDARRPFEFKGFEYKPYQGAVAGTMIPGWDRSAPRTFSTFIRDQLTPGLTLKAPAAYAIPPAFGEVIDRVKLHGLKSFVLDKPIADEFDTYSFSGVKFGAASFENRFMPTFTAARITDKRVLPAGTVVVPTNQVGAKLLMHLLEPSAPDSLVTWGFFNMVFEPKEYFEDYAMEPVAAKMLASDPKLKAEFEERLKDPVFAADARARLQWFYERSPYSDERLNKYPVVRLSSRQLAAAQR